MQKDGVYYFQTEMPGDESVVGWGAVRSPLSSVPPCCPQNTASVHLSYRNELFTAGYHI
jgi:hypothetical protein